MNLTKISFYAGMGLLAAVFLTNQASNIKGRWLLVLGLILIIPFVRIEVTKWIVKRKIKQQ